MKKIAAIAISTLCLSQLSAQNYQGYNTSNYSGVNGVFNNPASIADNNYRFDVNLLSISTLAANDQASFSLKNLGSGFNGDSISNKIFGKDAGPASGMFQVDIHGPSAMFNIGKKNSIAITTRARAFASVVDLDGKLFDKLSDGFNPIDNSLPYTISTSQDMRLSVNAWSEFGVSFARVLTQKGPHQLKGGITVKYLAGSGNGYINIDRFNGTIDQDLLLQDAYLRNTTGRLATGFGGINLSNAETGDLFDFNSSGIGTDIGFVYEFKPAASSSQPNNYLFKVGASVLDLGKIKYEKDMDRSGAYEMDITGNERLSLQELNNVELDDYNAFFSARPQFFTPVASNTENEYSVSLPTTLQLNVDYHVMKGFYVNGASQISMSTNKTKGYNNRTYSAFTLTPRYEGKKFGFFLPLNYNGLTKLNAGFSMRLGPLFIGSGSVLSALMGESKQADLFFGFRFGGLK